MEGGLCSVRLQNWVGTHRFRQPWKLKALNGGENSGSESTEAGTRAQNALERAAAYRKKRNEETEEKDMNETKDKAQAALEKAAAYTEKQKKTTKPEMEVEIITKDGVIKRKVSRPEDTFTVEIKKKGMEFVGLDFNEKKKPGKPAGLIAEFEPPPPGQLPQVEIITRDVKTASDTNEDLYKPTVSTWGVFPRPTNISKTYGGGRTIRPGEQIETEEERKAREDKTRSLMAEYRRKMGLEVDANILLECQKMMNEGEALVKSGKPSEALGNFESILQKMVFQSELHGQAALAKALCLESLNRTREARKIYEKLSSHSDSKVRKRAKQLIYSFEAAERLKMSGASTWDTNAYRQYFEYIPKNYTEYNTAYKASEDESVTEFNSGEVLLSVMVVFAPLIFVLVAAILKRHPLM